MRENGKKRQKDFVKKALEILKSYGAVLGGQYKYIIHTKAGILNIQLRDEQAVMFDVPMKFDDPKKAEKYLREEQLGSGLGNLNTWSGKYNVLYSKEEGTLEMLEYYLSLVTPKITAEFSNVTSLDEIEVGEVVQMTSPPFNNAVNRVVKIANDITELNRDIAYFGFYDRMRGGVPTAEKFTKNMKANKSTPHTFAVWGHSINPQDTVLEKYSKKSCPVCKRKNISPDADPESDILVCEDCGSEFISYNNEITLDARDDLSPKETKERGWNPL